MVSLVKCVWLFGGWLIRKCLLVVLSWFDCSNICLLLLMMKIFVISDCWIVVFSRCCSCVCERLIVIMFWFFGE